ncbi:hypothetical protein NKDENANG_02433 [Candidatus Entotheonellaceae bacterium PAL068K]
MNKQAFMSCDTSCDARFAFKPCTGVFPFTYELSLVPLIEFWNQDLSAGDHTVGSVLNTAVREALRQAPALLDPIEDLGVIAQHRELVDILMTQVFPQAFWQQTHAAALLPFHLQSFYATPSFEQLLSAEDGTLRGQVNVDEHTLDHVRLLHAYAFILKQVYGIDLDFDYPLISTTVDPDTGLDRHFRMDFDAHFMRIKTVGAVPTLTAEAKQRLLANLADPEVLMDILPPDRFIIQGFVVLNAVEVTDQEVLSSLKRELIDKESITSQTRFHSLERKLRTLFRKPELCFGLAAILRYSGPHAAYRGSA